jgi:hypothetical protein
MRYDGSKLRASRRERNAVGTNDGVFQHALETLLLEIFNGPPGSEAYVLNPGDPGLLRRLDSISAEVASARPMPGKTTVAAHVDHVLYGLTLLIAGPRANRIPGRGLTGTAAGSGEWSPTMPGTRSGRSFVAKRRPGKTSSGPAPIGIRSPLPGRYPALRTRRITWAPSVRFWRLKMRTTCDRSPQRDYGVCCIPRLGVSRIVACGSCPAVPSSGIVRVTTLGYSVMPLQGKELCIREKTARWSGVHD